MPEDVPASSKDGRIVAHKLLDLSRRLADAHHTLRRATTWDEMFNAYELRTEADNSSARDALKALRETPTYQHPEEA